MMKRATEVLMFIFYIIPIGVLVLWSFADRMPWPKLLPQRFNVTAWMNVLGDKGFLEALGNSISISLAVTALSIAISLPTAYCLVKGRFRGKALLQLLLVLPFIIPAISISIGAHSFYMIVGLTDTYIGVILAHLLVALPYSVRL
ncbi:MAG: binding-protein-dependent transport system inner rane component, partial [Clostridia bacterium]|nr:binding-protein-dependent transport system inner rane component [Clostridia bacterium]